jgi:hypothetical protein
MTERWRGVAEEDAVRKLLEDAGPRPAPPEEDIAAIRETAQVEWSRRYGAGAKRRRPRLPWLGVAAALVLAGIGLVWWTRARPAATATSVASIERVGRAAPWKVGSTFVAGSVLATDARTPGRVTLRMRGGASVRLDVGTEVRLASATVIELHRGGLYVDSGVAPRRAEEVAVRAGKGLFRPAGTQFQLRVENGETTLRVREGRVAMDRPQGSVVANAGEELVARGSGDVVRRRVAVSGPDWDWVAEAAPMLAIEGVKAREFLSWLGRETGLRIEVADAETADVADSCVLHGSIDQLTLADAPGVVLSSCGLGHRVSNGALVVFVAGKESRQDGGS